MDWPFGTSKYSNCLLLYKSVLKILLKKTMSIAQPCGSELHARRCFLLLFCLLFWLVGLLDCFVLAFVLLEAIGLYTVIRFSVY